MAVTRKPDIRRFWLTASLILVAGCTAPAVVGAWTDVQPRNIEKNPDVQETWITMSDHELKGFIGVEAPVSGATAQVSRGSRHQSFVALGRGTAGSRIPDAEAPVR